MRHVLLRRRILCLASIMVLAGAGAAAGVMRAGARTPSPLALVPGNFAALNAPATVTPNVPDQIQGPGAADPPAPGTVHALGHGKAFAWIHDGAVCWSAGLVSGCADPSPANEHGIDVTVGDPDLIQQGKPAQVSGLAVDSIVRVTATLVDGTTFSAVPVDNWYEISLPDTAAPWDVTRVAARGRSGRVLSIDVALHAPAVP
jgi:hypothetical protein